MSFATLGLDPRILSAVTHQGYHTPTPIQQQTIPVILEGKDVLAGAQTGTAAGHQCNGRRGRSFSVRCRHRCCPVQGDLPVL